MYGTVLEALVGVTGEAGRHACESHQKETHLVFQVWMLGITEWVVKKYV